MDEKVIPFEPEFGDLYYSYGNGTWDVLVWDWTDEAYDYIHKACGCVFRTEEEALEARPERYKALTGRDWSE